LKKLTLSFQSIQQSLHKHKHTKPPTPQTTMFSSKILLACLLLNLSHAAEKELTDKQIQQIKCDSLARAAIEKGELEDIKSCLSSGWDVNAKQKDDWVALYHAAGKGNMAIVSALLKAGAKVKTISNGGETALHRAAYRGQLKVIAALVKAGVNVNGKNNYDETALHRAAEYGDMEVLSALVDAGVDVDAINTINNTAVSSCTTGNCIQWLSADKKKQGELLLAYREAKKKKEEKK
jgi:ankyrin repeat protein